MKENELHVNVQKVLILEADAQNGKKPFHTQTILSQIKAVGVGGRTQHSPEKTFPLWA